VGLLEAAAAAAVGVVQLSGVYDPQRTGEWVALSLFFFFFFFFSPTFPRVDFAYVRGRGIVG